MLRRAENLQRRAGKKTMTSTIRDPEKLKDKAADVYRRAAMAANPHVKKALLENAAAYERQAKLVKGDLLVS